MAKNIPSRSCRRNAVDAKEFIPHDVERPSQSLALRKWRCFLEGRPFVIETDHLPLEFLRKETDDAQLCRVWEELEPFAYTIRYRPGVINGNADALSRVADYVHELDEPIVCLSLRG